MTKRRLPRPNRRVLIGAVAALAVVAAVAIVVKRAPSTSTARAPSGASTSSTTLAAPTTHLGVKAWLISNPDLGNLLQANKSLTTRMLNNPQSVLVGSSHPAAPPAGWKTSFAQDFTSLAKCATACAVFDPTKNRKVEAKIETKFRGTAPIGLFDDANSNSTAPADARSPCPAMAYFVSAAKGAGLHTIVAPDLSLASPKLVTANRGGETQSWQTYLRLGLAACAAATRPNDYHIMSQSLEGSESNFVNFVTQAALQARAVDPSVQLSDGLLAASKHGVPAAQMYQDAVDVENVVNTIWMNLVGKSAPKLTLNLFNDIAARKPATVRSSVLFAGKGSSSVPCLTKARRPAKARLRCQFTDFGVTVPSPATSSSMDLSHSVATATFVSAQTVPGGTAIPAGSFDLQYWTGPGKGAATVALALGYCVDNACTQRVPLIGQGKWDAVLTPNARGATTPGGALTTTSKVKLPAGGPHRLYWSVTVLTPAAFPLLFGSRSDPTNLATPLLLDVPYEQVATPIAGAAPTPTTARVPSKSHPSTTSPSKTSKVPPTTVRTRPRR